MINSFWLRNMIYDLFGNSVITTAKETLKCAVSYLQGVPKKQMNRNLDIFFTEEYLIP